MCSGVETHCCVVGTTAGCVVLQTSCNFSGGWSKRKRKGVETFDHLLSATVSHSSCSSPLTNQCVV